MKPWLVDVPVRVNIWIRRECQIQQFEVIKKARPSILFLISDGGRNEKEWEAIRANRDMFDNGIDWDCTIYKIYENKNNGLYAMGNKAYALIWEKVDRCIFLEDDYIPSVSYFAFCAELLGKYKDDERIEAICGMNHNGTWEKASSDYFFSQRGSIWGLASWKRCFNQRDPEHTYSKDEYVMNLLKNSTEENKAYWELLNGYANDKLYGNHIAGGEFFHGFEIYGQNRLYIIPKYNMICNVGCTNNSTHAKEYKLMPKRTRKMFNMKTYEYSFPLKHPQYVIPDYEYAKIFNNSKFVYYLNRLEHLLLVVRYKGLSGIIKKVKKHSKNKSKIET